MKQIKKLTVVMTIFMIMIANVPLVSAWGDITHQAISSGLNNVPTEIKTYEKYAKGGGIGPDMFYFLPGKEYFSYMAHTTRTADLPRDMLTSSNVGWKKAYAYGWLGHAASDIVGHTQYVNPRAGTDVTLHAMVEIGVDANLVDVTGISFSVPYSLVQNGYRDIYMEAPSQMDIYNAARNTAMVLYIEKSLIKAGVFDNLKNQYNDFWNVYGLSIYYSEAVINNPAILPNLNLYTGEGLGTSGIGMVGIEMRNAAIELIRENAVMVPINENKENKVFYVGEPIIKDSKRFNEKIEKIKENIKNKEK